MKKEKEIKYSASVILQISLILGFFILIGLLLYKPFVEFISGDTPPPIVQIIPHKIIRQGGDPAIVTIGLYIKNFPAFDVAHNKFTADLTLWFLFDPNRISIEKLQKFTFDRGKILYQSKPLSKKEKRKLFTRINVQVEFTTKLFFENFPLDDHKICLSLTNYLLSPSDVIFKSDRANILMNPEINILGWTLVDKSVFTGYIKDQLDPYFAKETTIYHPRTIFCLDFARSGIRHIISILLPLTLIFFICLFTLTFDPYSQLSSIISISVASISAVIAQRFIIEGMSPKPGYVMISDKFFVLILIGCSIIFTINIISKKITGPYKNLLTILLHAYLIIGCLTFFLPLL